MDLEYLGRSKANDLEREIARLRLASVAKRTKGAKRRRPNDDPKPQRVPDLPWTLERECRPTD